MRVARTHLGTVPNFKLHSAGTYAVNIARTLVYPDLIKTVILPYHLFTIINEYIKQKTTLKNTYALDQCIYIYIWFQSYIHVCKGCHVHLNVQAISN